MGKALRPLQEADSAMLLAWRNSPEVSRFMYTEHRIGEREHAAWLARALHREDARYWIITDDGRDVGLASVTEIDRTQRTCSWAIYLGDPAVRGRGLGAFTTYSVLCHVFDELGLRKCSCEVLATNPAALAMYERFGFVREGRLREQILKSDGPVDVHRLGILDREWVAAREGHRQRLEREGILTA